MIISGIIIGIIALTVLVVAHELGHALVARRYGTVVEEFGIGFPPRAWAKKVKKSFLGKNVTYSINWLPLGGFVKMQGEHDSDKGKGDYGAMTFWQKTQVLLAGVAMNWLLAVVLFTILALFGIPKLLPEQFSVDGDTQRTTTAVEIASVTAGLPAETAGLKVGDQVLRVDNQAVTDPLMFTNYIAEKRGETVTIDYTRGNEERSASVQIRDDDSDKQGYLGVGPTQREYLRSTWSAPIVGVGLTSQLTWETLKGVGTLLWNGITGLVMKVVPNHDVQQKANAQLADAGNSVAGPLAIFGVLFPAAEQAGPAYVLAIAALISLTLAVMNILPIPALDGGRWFVTALYRLMKKPLTVETEEKIHGTGFMILLGLIVLVTIADIGKLL